MKISFWNSGFTANHIFFVEVMKKPNKSSLRLPKRTKLFPIPTFAKSTINMATKASNSNKAEEVINTMTLSMSSRVSLAEAGTLDIKDREKVQTWRSA